jgi:hypothetical protein
MITRTHSFRILVLWIIPWMMNKRKQEQEHRGTMELNDYQGWHFIYWDDPGGLATQKVDISEKKDIFVER